MKKTINKFFFLFAITIGAILLTSCSSLSNANQSDNPVIRTINVSGTGSVNVAPDITTFNVQIKETEKTTSMALKAMNQKVAQVLNTLDGFDILEKDRKTNSINLRTDYDWIDQKQVIVGQVASQSINVKLRDTKTLGPIIDALSQINEISIGSVSFSKENTESEEAEVRILAIEDAYNKAVALAKASNMVLLSPISINNSSSPVNYNYPTMVKSMAVEESYSGNSTQAPTGEIKITGNVNVMYEMTAE